MKKEEPKISFTRDIIKQASKELDMPESKVRAVYDSQIKYLKHLTDNTDAVAIFIPFIGTLHVKVWFLFQQIKKYSKKTSDKLKLDIFKSKKDIVDTHIQEYIVNSHIGKTKHLEKNKINRFIYNGGKTMDEIEEIQNAR